MNAKMFFDMLFMSAASVSVVVFTALTGYIFILYAKGMNFTYEKFKQIVRRLVLIIFLLTIPGLSIGGESWHSSLAGAASAILIGLVVWIRWENE
jgi:O-antigen/teichoic acid export membrane protein